MTDQPEVADPDAEIQRLREVLGAAPCVCPECGGDGKETCNNPDHGFIVAVGGETGRLGCPGCGHDPAHKVRGGGPCDLCNGAKTVSLSVSMEYCGIEFQEAVEAYEEPERIGWLLQAHAALTPS